MTIEVKNRENGHKIVTVLNGDDYIETGFLDKSWSLDIAQDFLKSALLLIPSEEYTIKELIEATLEQF
jgi:hypothetical protein